MKARTQIILAGTLLIGLVAWSAARRGTCSDSAGQSCATCCPFLPMLDGMRLSSVTNGTTTNGTPSQSSATNPTPSPRQP